MANVKVSPSNQTFNIEKRPLVKDEDFVDETKVPLKGIVPYNLLSLQFLSKMSLTNSRNPNGNHQLTVLRRVPHLQWRKQGSLWNLRNMARAGSTVSHTNDH